MREFKFRGWDEQSSIMHKDVNFIRSGCEDNDWVVFISDKNTLDSKPHPFENPYFFQQIKMMQYTGLKDKNGVEIYEGDIVDCYWLAELGVCEIDCQHKGVVRFVDCRFEVSFSDKAFIRNIGEDGVYSATELELTCMSHDDDYAVEYEVIGNIYENPELLKSPD